MAAPLASMGSKFEGRNRKWPKTIPIPMRAFLKRRTQTVQWLVGSKQKDQKNLTTLNNRVNNYQLCK